jgi:hypothetical protein
MQAPRLVYQLLRWTTGELRQRWRRLALAALAALLAR